MSAPISLSRHDRRGEVRIVVLAPILILLPFINKAYHIDDPLFLWLAGHIQSDPVRFYDFNVDWHLSSMPMHAITMNPPGGGYFIAVAAWLFGWTEPAMHAAFLFPAVLASLGTYCLARECCANPLMATLVAVLSPVFVVSSTNVMSDTLMLACYVWPIVFWIRGITHGNTRLLAIASAIIAVGILVKYLAITLLPLLIAYTIAQRKRATWDLIWLLLPVATITGYHFLTIHLYGKSLILGASGFATGHATMTETINAGTRVAVDLAFLGGCYLGVVFTLFLRHTRRMIVTLSGSAIVTCVTLLVVNRVDSRWIRTEEEFRWGFLLQASLFIAVGVLILGLALHDLYRRRDPISLTLCLWIVGIFMFAGFVNWTINGRTLLAAAPAVGIIAARWLERLPGQRISFPAYLSLIPTVVLSVAVAWGDYERADAGRNAAASIRERTQDLDTRIIYQGHWGFQYYMKNEGYAAFDQDKGVRPGEIVIIPENSPSTTELPPEISRRIIHMEETSGRFITTMHRDAGAGFYSHFWGPLPYVFGEAPKESYDFLEITLPPQVAERDSAP